MDKYNNSLNPKGVYLTVLKKQNNCALIYVYRVSHLKSDLKKECVKCLLSTYGYSDFSAHGAIEKLKEHFNTSEKFPHEIGLFLGYPPDDVHAFIKNSGRNFIFTGCWKVYHNEFEAVKTFAKFDKCKQIYCRLWKEGMRTVQQLTVAA